MEMKEISELLKKQLKGNFNALYLGHINLKYFISAVGCGELYPVVSDLSADYAEYDHYP